MKDVVQKTLSAGKTATFEMQLSRSKFLVKNFTTGNLEVTLGDNDTHCTIGPQSWELVCNNADERSQKHKYLPEATKIVKVKAVEAGMVEVEAVD